MMAGRRVVTEIEIDDLLRPGNRTVMRYANLTPKENAEKMFTKDALGKW
jgi:Arc/MetJ family transcription regulator